MHPPFPPRPLPICLVSRDEHPAQAVLLRMVVQEGDGGCILIRAAANEVPLVMGGGGAGLSQRYIALGLRPGVLVGRDSACPCSGGRFVDVPFHLQPASLLRLFGVCVHVGSEVDNAASHSSMYCSTSSAAHTHTHTHSPVHFWRRILTIYHTGVEYSV